MYPPKGRHWKDGQDKLLAALKEWAPYELRVIDDYEKRCDICGGDVPLEISAIMLSIPEENAKEIALQRYNHFPWPSYFFLAKGLGIRSAVLCFLMCFFHAGRKDFTVLTISSFNKAFLLPHSDVTQQLSRNAAEHP